MKGYLTVRSIVAVATAVVAAAVVVGFAASSSEGGPASPVGQPPPEWAANTWPAHNHDLSNTRATSQSPINSQTVSQLKVKWRFPLKGAGEFGLFSSTPIVVNGTVYFQDLNSNVFALDRNTGALKWDTISTGRALAPTASRSAMAGSTPRPRHGRLPSTLRQGSWSGRAGSSPETATRASTWRPSCMTGRS